MLTCVWRREHRLSSPANELSSAELRAMAAWPRGAVDTWSPCHAEAPLCSTSQPLVLFSRRLKEITDGPRLSKATVAPLAEMKLPLLSPLLSKCVVTMWAAFACQEPISMAHRLDDVRT